jgi:hypothetical protein
MALFFCFKPPYWCLISEAIVPYKHITKPMQALSARAGDTTGRMADAGGGNVRKTRRQKGGSANQRLSISPYPTSFRLVWGTPRYIRPFRI